MKKITIAGFALAAFLLAGCNNADDHDINGSLTQVGVANDFYLNNAPAASIILSKDKSHFLTLSINSNSLYTLLTKKEAMNYNQNNPNIDASLNWNGHFIIDKNKPSGLVLRLESLNKENNTAKIHYTVTLVSPKADTNKTIQLSDSFTLSGSNWQKIDKLYQQQQKLQAKQDSQNKETSN
ncbi:hypothetical protein [Photobacterium leiognathi]|uniref:hypothetical protein n=1 Tax=Photobacterium leiognathi TaxID=553611 RepID=UPI003AF3330B